MFIFRCASFEPPRGGLCTTISFTEDSLSFIEIEILGAVAKKEFYVAILELTHVYVVRLSLYVGLEKLVLGLTFNLFRLETKPKPLRGRILPSKCHGEYTTKSNRDNLQLILRK
jgi:hypothetical protein